MIIHLTFFILKLISTFFLHVDSSISLGRPAARQPSRKFPFATLNSDLASFSHMCRSGAESDSHSYVRSFKRHRFV